MDACPILDEASQRYRLYMGDGSYSDIPVLDIISSGTVNNMYGWLGDSICVLEQDSSSRSTFRLHAANTATGITYTLLTPWEYADMVNSASANSSEPTGTPVSGIISSMQSGEATKQRPKLNAWVYFDVNATGPGCGAFYARRSGACLYACRFRRCRPGAR